MSRVRDALRVAAASQKQIPESELPQQEAVPLFEGVFEGVFEPAILTPRRESPSWLTLLTRRIFG